MLITKKDIINWGTAFFILALLAVATKLCISAIINLSNEFYLPF